MLKRLMWFLIVMLVGLGGWMGVLAQEDSEAPLILIEAEADKLTPYVGEQVIYSVRIFNTTTSAPDYTTPPFEGFWSAGTLGITKYEENNYGVTLIETVLFPLRDGTLMIPPGKLEFSPNQVYQAETEIVSNEVTIEVQPLPEGAPADFSDAVGGPFFMVANMGRTSANEGDPISLEVQVEGAGNVEQIDPPVLPFGEDWRVYPLPSTFEPQADDRRYIGTKTFNWLIVPPESGTVVLPEISMSYFDTNLLTYNTIQTEAISLSILPVEGAEPAAIEDVLASIQPGVLPLQVPSARGSWVPFGVPWLFWLLPPGVLLSLGFWQWYQWRQGHVVVRRRREQAIRRVRSMLAGVGRQPGDQGYQVLMLAILTYFADRWNVPVEGLDVEDLREGMRVRKVDGEAVERLMTCFTLAEEGRYSPEVAPPPRGLVKETLTVLMAVDSMME